MRNNLKIMRPPHLSEMNKMGPVTNDKRRFMGRDSTSLYIFSISSTWNGTVEKHSMLYVANKIAVI